jgi:HTH-type transcriptional regulator / antitoxin HigA
MGTMDIRPIRTKKDHSAALAEVERLIALDPARGTDDGDRLEVLSILVERYEKEHFPIAPPSPIEAIEFRMDQMGLRKADLVPYLGSRSRASEILAGKRELTLPMIRALNEELGIPLKSLVGGAVRSRRRMGTKSGRSVRSAASLRRRRAAAKGARSSR